MPIDSPMDECNEIIEVNIHWSRILNQMRSAINSDSLNNKSSILFYWKVCMFLFLFVFYGLVPLISGLVDQFICKIHDPSSLQLNFHLMCLGVVTSIFSFIHTIACCCEEETDNSFYRNILKMVWDIFRYIFMLIGTYVLFGPNRQCITERNVQAIYYLVLWCVWCLELLYHVVRYFLMRVRINVL